MIFYPNTPHIIRRSFNYIFGHSVIQSFSHSVIQSANHLNEQSKDKECEIKRRIGITID